MVVARLDDAVADAQRRARDRRGRRGSGARAARSLSASMPTGPRCIGDEHLHVGDRVEAVVARAGARRRARRPRRTSRSALSRSIEEEVAHVVAAPGSRRRRLAVVDRVRGAHDQRARGLAEDLGQPRRRARRRESIRSSSTRPGADRRELVDVADEQHVRARADRAEQRVGEAHGRASRPRRRRARRRRRSGRPASRAKPSPGIHSSSRWIVVASAPVASARRRAALPVGAQRRTVRALRAHEVDERAHRRASCRCPGRR